MLIGKKVGMTRVFSEEGKSIPVTVIKASPCFVIDRRTEERDGYTAYVMGFGEKKEKRVKKPVLGLCKKAGVPPVEVIREFRTEDTSSFEIGEKVPVSVLQKGDRIDIVGWSKGRGFQGVVKRWGFSGGPGSHGSRFGRAPGSAGAGTYPGRVLKGKKFPGRMGGDRVTVRNLEIVNLDEENGLIVVKGAVPGFRNGLLLIKIGSDIDISARKELAKEKAEKGKEKPEKKERIEEKAEEVEEEKKEEETATDKKEKETKDKKAEEEKEETEGKIEETKEKVEKKTEKTEKKTEEKTREEDKSADDKEKDKKAEDKEKNEISEEVKEKVKKEKTESKEEKKETKVDKKIKSEDNKENNSDKKENKNEEKGDS